MSEKFYVAVTKNGRPEAKPGNVGLIAGPFDTLEQAQEQLAPATRYVRDNYYGQGADWWGYAVIGVADYDKPGKLNEQLGIKSPSV